MSARRYVGHSLSDLRRLALSAPRCCSYRGGGCAEHALSGRYVCQGHADRLEELGRKLEAEHAHGARVHLRRRGGGS